MSTTDVLSEQAYLSERIDPAAGQESYLHLSDLRLALEAYRSDQPLRVLDFGCGGSPYRSLFPKANYNRADCAGIANLDYVINEDGAIDEPDNTFDLILSTQVLEHVPDPATYLAEARRLLKPGGLLLCSTHGSFEDHACPDDFWRWTSEGLRRTLIAAGFAVEQMSKLTTGPRAMAFTFERNHAELWAQMHKHRSSALRLVLWPFICMLQKHRRYLHLACDRYFPDHRVVLNGLERHIYYVVLMAACRKPEK